MQEKVPENPLLQAVVQIGNNMGTNPNDDSGTFLVINNNTMVKKKNELRIINTIQAKTP